MSRAISHCRLVRDDGGPAAIALLDNFKEVVTSWGVENLQAEIVQDQHFGARQRPANRG